ncbi:hypothetical protein M758_3G172800 [Ceratodon purpureus]|nr:hypothetical protein M758_3G172800 [Ceratodon purpureus]
MIVRRFCLPARHSPADRRHDEAPQKTDGGTSSGGISAIPSERNAETPSTTNNAETPSTTSATAHTIPRDHKTPSTCPPLPLSARSVTIPTPKPPPTLDPIPPPSPPTKLPNLSLLTPHSLPLSRATSHQIHSRTTTSSPSPSTTPHHHHSTETTTPTHLLPPQHQTPHNAPH